MWSQYAITSTNTRDAIIFATRHIIIFLTLVDSIDQDGPIRHHHNLIIHIQMPIDIFLLCTVQNLNWNGRGLNNGISQIQSSKNEVRIFVIEISLYMNWHFSRMVYCLLQTLKDRFLFIKIFQL